MLDTAAGRLRGRRLLVVEDEYLIAMDIVAALEDHGADVVGPAASVDDALALIEREVSLDGAVLDVNLGGQRVYPVADALLGRGVPYVFATGYDSWILPSPHDQAPRLEKPADTTQIARALSGLIDR